MLELWALIAAVFGGFGGWIALQKRRVAAEGFALPGPPPPSIEAKRAAEPVVQAMLF